MRAGHEHCIHEPYMSNMWAQVGVDCLQTPILALCMEVVCEKNSHLYYHTLALCMGVVHKPTWVCTVSLHLTKTQSKRTVHKPHK